MSSWIVYLLEVNVTLILCMGAYKFFMRAAYQSSVNRIFLLAGLVLSFSLPAMPSYHPFETSLAPAVSKTLNVYWSDEVTAGRNVPKELKGPNLVVSLEKAAGWGYLLISAGIALLFLLRLAKVVRLILTIGKYRWLGCWVAESEIRTETFSFFNFVFLGQVHLLSATEKNKILQHEHVHAMRGHSFDILLINVVGIICWFNPIVGSYRRSLVQLHEFEADEAAVSENEIDFYCGVMAKVALLEAGFPLVNHFHTSLTTQRITMMKTIKTRIQNWKIASLIAAFPIIFFIVSCQDQVISDISSVGKNAAVAGDIPKEVQQRLDYLQNLDPKKEYIVLQLNEDGSRTLAKIEQDKPEGYRSSNVTTMNTYRPDGTVDKSFAFVVKDKQAIQISEMTITDDEVYSFVEQVPVYPGGFDSLREYVRSTLQYPEVAKKSGIHGRVLVQFIIEKDGTVSNARVIKGIDPTCDKAAVDVVAGFRPWIPGMQKGQPVRVKFVVPINFSLG